MLKRVVATGVGLVLACAAAACGTDAADEVLPAPGTSVAATGSPSPGASGAAVEGLPTQKLGAAAYVTSSPSPSATSATSAKPPNSAGFGGPVFVENFNGPLSSVWGKYDTVAGTPPRSGDQVSVSGGMLHITGGYNSRVGKDVGGGVMYLKDMMYGRWEVRFRVDAGAGYTGVVLLWPKENADWPTVGEIDLAEITAPERKSIGSFLHHGSENHKVGVTDVKADFTKFHTLAVDWLPNRVTYYVDGKKYFSVAPGDIETGLPDESPLHLALQLDQGCNDYAPCRNADTPKNVVMDVDWVKIYKAS